VEHEATTVSDEEEQVPVDRLRQVEKVLGIVTTVISLGYVVWVITPIHDEAWRAITFRRARRLYVRLFGCCAPCRAERRAQREVLWQAMEITGQIP
jgi:hypothetical protein